MNDLVDRQNQIEKLQKQAARLLPRWLAALVAQGKSKEDFAIKC